MNNAELNSLVDFHREYWSTKRHRMAAYTRAYKGEMFENTEDYNNASNNMVTINTADTYAYVEGFVASLYSKSPAVSVGGAADGRGNPEVMEACANQFLYNKIEQVERGLRYSLIYPYSFYKLALNDRDSVLDAVEIRSVHPWDVIVDFDADSWDRSRFVGHRYYLPYNEAKRKFPGVRLNPMHKEDYLKIMSNTAHETQSNQGELDGSHLLSYVEVYEFYDLMEDELIFYVPSAERANKVLDRISPIPFRKADGSPCPPLAPIYLSYSPDQPLRGYSSVARVYDQLWEINNLRTVWANGLRRDARLYVTRKGAVDEEGKSILAENRDMSIVELDVPPDIDARNAIVPLATATFSPDYQIYKAEVRGDLDRGTVLAPFTRGIATNASATEVAALTQYASNEIGRMARFFHRSIEHVAEIYQSLIFHLIMTNDEEMTEVVLIEAEPTVLTRQQFEGKFRFAFADQASTPMAGAVKRQSIQQLIPVLPALGADPAELLAYVVKVFDLPEEFLPKLAAPADAGLQEGATEQPEAEEPAVPVGGGNLAAGIRSEGQAIIGEALVGEG
tara:strand:+ start:3077 stop:4765 length:1689 start_codon:yes stop_codon:yes gene_type:complete